MRFEHLITAKSDNVQWPKWETQQVKLYWNSVWFNNPKNRWSSPELQYTLLYTSK